MAKCGKAEDSRYQVLILNFFCPELGLDVTFVIILFSLPDQQ